MSKKILDFSTISGESVKKYEGIKKYIAPGDIQIIKLVVILKLIIVINLRELIR